MRQKRTFLVWKLPKDLLEKAWHRVLRRSIRVETGCLLYSGSCTAAGYGVIGVQHYQVYAHRLVWAFVSGRRIGQAHICHHCDTPNCVEPTHLFPGNAAQNSADMKAKGRSARGERNGQVKLTEATVRAIRAEYGERPRYQRGGVTMEEIADRYGVCWGTVSDIVRRRTWKHLS